MNDPKTAPLRRFNCRVEQVHSGDDMIVMADLGIDGLHKRTRVRLRGVDTPDAYKEKAESRAGKVREQVRRLVLNKPCYIDVHSQGKSSWIVTLYVSDEGEEVCLNDMLIESGYVYQQKRDT